ncbi:MAG: hypothetical protein ACFCVG_09445 [Kineosporiaceae bacterium]
MSPEGGGCRFIFVTTVQDPEHIPYSAAGYFQAVEEGLAGLLDADAKGKPDARQRLSFEELVERVTAEWKLDE